MAGGDFFKLGRSAASEVEQDLVDSTNRSLSELNFDNASFMQRSGRGNNSVRKIGDVRGFDDNITGFITTPGVANSTLSPTALDLRSSLVASSWSLSDGTVSLNSFASFLNAEDINMPNMTQQQMGTFEGLNFSPGWFNKSKLASMGHDTDISRRARPLQVAFHEMGHTASRSSGTDKLSQRVTAFDTALSAPSRDVTGMTTNYLELVRERAFEEARAETFSYSALGKTTTGQEYLSHIKTVDLTQDLSSHAIRGNTFSSTAYYHFNDFATKGFDLYANMGTQIEGYMQASGIDMTDLSLRARILGTGTVLGATDFGDYSEVFDPLRETIISKNREYILANHGQQHVDVFDEALKIGQENRFSVTGIQGALPTVVPTPRTVAPTPPTAPPVPPPTVAPPTAPPPTVAPPNAPAPRVAPTVAPTTPPTSRGPSGLGTPANVKTTPGPHGAPVTAPAAPTPSPRPVTSPTAPTAKIINKTAQQDVDLTAREALRRMGGDIRTARKPGQKLLSAEGSKAMAEAVTKGIKGSRNLKMLAVGSALGLGGYTANRLANRNDTSDLGG